MGHRYYVCPVVIDPKEPTNRVLKVMLYHHLSVSGTVRIGANWALARVEANDFSEIDADTDNRDVFEALTDTAGTSRATIVNWLKNTNVGSIPAARRNSIQTRLTNLGIDLTGINLASKLWDVVVRVHRFHAGHDLLEQL